MNPDPIITYLAQINEHTVKIKWNLSSTKYLSRYRIEISSDNFVNKIYEWPSKFIFNLRIF